MRPPRYTERNARAIATSLHRQNLTTFKPIHPNETANFEDLETPQCKNCGADPEGLFNTCPTCAQVNDGK
jgi:hypothetical protein